MVSIPKPFGESSAIPSFAQALERLLNPYEEVSLRVPFYMSSTWRKQRGIKGVSMAMNPQSVRFRQNKRITTRDTQGGKVVFHWTDMTGRDNDLLEIDFEGTSGNVNLRRGAYKKGGWADEVAGKIGQATDWLNQKASEGSQAMESAVTGITPTGVSKNLAGAYKLAGLWNLYSLTHEPVLDMVTGAPITYYIGYSSPLFGNTMMQFQGYFSKPMEITDDANDPFQKRWSFSFVALDSTPSMDLIYTVMLANLGRDFLNNLE